MIIRGAPGAPPPGAGEGGAAGAAALAHLCSPRTASQWPGIRMEDFESYAIDRLCVLKEIEAQKAKGVQPICREDPGNRFKILQWLGTQDGTKNQQRKDQISHYALRLAYCKTDDQRRWYVTQETALFRHPSDS